MLVSASCAEIINNLMRNVARIEIAILRAKRNKHPAIAKAVTHHPVNLLVSQQKVRYFANHIGVVDAADIAN